MDVQTQAQLPDVYKSLIAERESLLVKARAIAQQCNGLAPISKLVPEILLRIFALNSGPISKKKFNNILEEFEDVRSSDPTTGLRFISQVCQHWRILALGSPTLWNVVLDCHLPSKWITELLRRSHSLPLKVRVNLFSVQRGKAVTNFRSILPEIHRLGELTAIATTTIIAKTLFKPMNKPLTMLRSLTLSSDHNMYLNGDREITEEEEYDSESSESDDSEFDEGNLFLPDLPNEAACNITTLNTSGCIFRLDSPLYQHLTDLSVFEVSKQAISLSVWMSGLQAIENLASLVLVNTFSRHNVNDLQNLPQLSLPHLTDLRLVGHSTPCSQFLMCLSISPLRSLDIRLKGANRSGLSLKVVDAIIPHLAHQAKSTTFDMLKIVFTDIFFSFTNTDSPKKFEPHFRVLLTGSRSWDSNSLTLVSELAGHYDERRRCYLAMIPVVNALMAPFVALKHLQINYETTAAVIDIDPPIPHKKEKSDGEEQQPVLFLSDYAVQLHNLTILRSNGIAGFKVLKEYLIWRAELGKPISCLRFKQNILRDMSVQYEKLRPYCGELIWESRQPHDRRLSVDSNDSINFISGGDYDGDMIVF